MKYYIVHYSKNTERRVEMEKQLESIGATDVEWITEYDKEDEFISKIKEKTGSPLTPAEISCSVKHFEAMRRMVRDNIEEAIILEDDVVFEIGLTPNRSDAASHYGVARDLAAVLNCSESGLPHAPEMVGANLKNACSAQQFPYIEYI